MRARRIRPGLLNDDIGDLMEGASIPIGFSCGECFGQVPASLDSPIRSNHFAVLREQLRNLAGLPGVDEMTEEIDQVAARE